MSDKFACCIDKERLNGSIKTLNSIEDSLSARDLSTSFIDIEEKLKNINFNHNNCINYYKESINYILEELNYLKKDINIRPVYCISSNTKFKLMQSSRRKIYERKHY